MPEETNEPKEPMVLLSSFPLDDPAGAEEEKIDSLWRQMMVYKAFEQDLSEARARRVEAEMVRERAEQEAYHAAQSLSFQMRTEAEHELNESREQRRQATEANQQARDELARAKETVAKAEKERDQIIEDAKKQSQEIIDKARATAQHEVTELRRQALKEIKAVLGRVENMRAAANEELETQRILSNVSKLRATSQWIQSGPQSEGRGNDSQPESSAPTNEPATVAVQPSSTTSGSESSSSSKADPKKSPSSDKS